MTAPALPARCALWLARHAQVQAPPGLCYGSSDLPACPQATAQAAAHLAARLPRMAQVRVSPLSRCLALARALAALRPDLPPAQEDARLREMHFGVWEMQRWDDIPRPAFDAWLADFAHARPGQAGQTGQGDHPERAGQGGGPEAAPGESVSAFMQRIAAAWDETCQTLAPPASSAAAPRAHLWITHAGVLRAALLLHQGQRHPRHASDWPTQSAPFGQALELPLPAPIQGKLSTGFS